MDERDVLIFLLFLVVQVREPAIAEWVEIPQFSDGQKVYREPANKFVGSQKLHVLNTKRPSSFHEFRNVTAAVVHAFDKIHANKHPGAPQSWITKPTESSLSGMDPSQFTVTEETVYLSGISPWSTIRAPQGVENFPDDSQFDDATVDDEDEEYVTVSTINPDDRVNVIDKNQTTKTNGSAHQETPRPEEESKPKPSLLYFIPIQLFKKVHATLKAQPGTLKGKIIFLRNVQTSLLAEIRESSSVSFGLVRARDE